MNQFLLLIDSPFKLFKDIRSHTIFATFSFISVIMVILISSLGYELVNSGNFLQLYQSESLAGQIDVLMIAPQFWRVDSYQSRLNSSKISQLIGDKTACRMSFQTKFSLNEGISHNLIAIDFFMESTLKIGSQFHWEALTSDEVLVSQNLATAYNLQTGSTIQLIIDIRDLIKHLNLQDVKEGFLSLKLKIKGIIFNSKGKFSSNQMNRIFVIEQRFLISLISENLSNLSRNQKEQLSKMKISEYCNEVLYNFPDRYQLYSNPDQVDVRYQVTMKAQQIRENIGDFQVELYLPVLSELQNWFYANQYIGITFKAVLLILFFLSYLLVYNFITIMIDDKLTSLGILRLTGTDRKVMAFFLVYQSLRLLLPAVFIGLLISAPTQIFLITSLQKHFEYQFVQQNILKNIIFSGLIGVMIPICAAILPIKNVLSVKLSDLLNYNLNKTKAIKIDIYNEKNSSFNWSLMIFATICITFGGAMYIFLPMSLFTYDFFWLLTFVSFILLGYLIGFILLSLNIQYLVERFLHLIVSLYTNQTLSFLALKNLTAHRLRNRRTSLMYSISISFIVFLWTCLNILLENTYDVKLRQYGAQIELHTKSEKYNFYQMMEVEKFLQSEQLKDQIDNFSWVTQSLNEFQATSGLTEIFITSFGKNVIRIAEVIGVQSSLIDVTDSKFWEFPIKTLNRLNPIQNLYSREGHNSMLIPYARHYQAFSYDANILQLIFINGSNSNRHTLKVSGAYSSAPLFEGGSVLVSIPTFIRLANMHYQNISQIPFRRLLIKAREQNYDKINEIVSALEAFIDQNKYPLIIRSISSDAKILQENKMILYCVFIGFLALMMFLSFFSLYTTMSANIYEQTKEIAILRCLGLQQSQIKVIYNREAFIIVASSSLVGFFVGMIVGFTMASQSVVFQFGKAEFQFPYLTIVVIFMLSLLISYLATTQSANKMVKNTISDIIRFMN